MTSLPGLGPERPRTFEIARIKRVAMSLIDDDDVTVFVSELACVEPGCPPIETVIALLGRGDPVQHTIHKPAAEVTELDVVAVLRPS
jgi:hypothetical protein